MPDFLVEGDDRIAIFRTSTYPGCWILENTMFMVLNSALELAEKSGIDTVYKLGHKDSGIAAAFRKYQANNLQLFRGISSCHFSWPGLQGGELKSEGNADRPTFTMGNVDGEKTRWLPTAQTDAEAAAIGIQDVDTYTRALSMTEPVFIGLSVSIRIQVLRHSVCWYNSGELGVRGPLSAADYGFGTMLWLDAQQVLFHAWPNAVSNTTLPPQRPYKPANERQINSWWSKSQDWANTIAQRDIVISTRRDQSMLLVDIYD